MLKVKVSTASEGSNENNNCEAGTLQDFPMF
jgi:hypothetical protein